ncbi:hypothetical protein CQW23_16608 [Capsicum baccatum]|uniref:PAS fold-2 domain-containing protein n=1 Tax=Capsicum baccatum TaxID=33114 RepID=A0A2G2WBF2_CAPBA|nr:hypothetical protein CQW23_16608 [Capsicum baccatum]
MDQYNVDAKLMAEFEKSSLSNKSFGYSKSVTYAPEDANEEEIIAYLSKIQKSGLVQPFGCMFAIEEPSFKIIGYSENCFDMLGLKIVEPFKLKEPANSSDPALPLIFPGAYPPLAYPPPGAYPLAGYPVVYYSSPSASYHGTMAPKARQGKEKVTTSQKGKKRSRKDQGESSSAHLPRRMFGIKWVLEEEAKAWYSSNKERKYVHVDLINKETLANKEP